MSEIDLLRVNHFDFVKEMSSKNLKSLVKSHLLQLIYHKNATNLAKGCLYKATMLSHLGAIKLFFF